MHGASPWDVAQGARISRENSGLGWHCIRQPAIGATLANRQSGQSQHILQIAWRAQHRLHRLHQRLRERGKPHNVTTVAIARELAGFLWAAATA